METFNKILSAVKNHNKIYSVMLFWLLWLFVVVPLFKGNLSLIVFFIGFCFALLCGAYITDNPNKKERKTLNKWLEYLEKAD